MTVEFEWNGTNSKKASFAHKTKFLKIESFLNWGECSNIAVENGNLPFQRIFKQSCMAENIPVEEARRLVQYTA